MRPGYPGPQKTDRLLLMPPEFGDADAIAEALRGSLRQWLRWSSLAARNRAVENMRESAAEQLEANATGESFAWRVVRRETGELVGGVDLHSIAWVVPRCEIGYWGTSGSHGHGFMTEAVTQALRVAFDDLGMARVEARCDARNVRAHRLALRVGMQREGLFRSFERDAAGELCDIAVFATTGQ